MARTAGDRRRSTPGTDIRAAARPPETPRVEPRTRAGGPTDGLVGKAAPLWERLDRVRGPEASGLGPGRSHEAERILETWRKSLGVDAAGLERRLRWDGLDRASVERALALEGEDLDTGPTPSWRAVLAEAYGEGPEGPPAVFAKADPAADRCLDPDALLPFETLLVPLVRAGRRRVRRGAGPAYAGLRPGAHVRLERSLLQRLVEVCARPLYAEFGVHKSVAPPVFSILSDSDAVYRAFLEAMTDGRIWSFFREYAVAARLCGVAVELWAEAVVEFLVRLAADRADLGDELGDGGDPGAVIRVEADMGDAHGGGRSVLLLEFESGLRVVYKPRSVELDEFFSDFLAWIGDTGELLPMQSADVVPRDGYGWIEFVARAPCRSDEELRRFFTRCGVLTCLAYALNGSDFHMENLIAAGEQPVLIDLEALLGHRFRLEHLTESRPGTLSARIEHFEQSVLRVGLLPLLKVEGAGHALDIGGITGEPRLEEPVEAPFWRAVNTDRMRLDRRPVTGSGRSRNRAMLGDEPVEADTYVDEVLDGFTRTYRLLVDRRGELLGEQGLLQELRGRDVRFIFRPTSLYASVLQRALHPAHLRDGVRRSLQLDVLAKAFLGLDERPGAWAIVEAETRAMERMDVPLFTGVSDGTGLRMPDGDEIPGLFERSAWDVAEARLRELGPDDLELQRRLIRGAFAVNRARGLRSTTGARAPAESTPAIVGDRRGQRPAAGSRPPPPSAARGDGRLELASALPVARRLADEIRASALRVDDGGAAWYAARYVPGVRRFSLDVSNYSLVDGGGGIAVFLAALEHVDPGRGAGELARDVFRPLEHDIDVLARRAREGAGIDVGGGTGLGSALYALVLVSRLLDDPALMKHAGALRELLTPEVVAGAGAADVVSGQAGAVLGLVSLHEAVGDPASLAAAEAAADVLLASRVADPETGLRGWRGREGRPEPGFAHGQAGIAHTLHRLYEAGGRRGDDWCSAAGEAIELERALTGAGLEAVAASEPRAAWSQGATGIGLARLSGLAVAGPAVGRDLDAAVETARRHLEDGCDTLGCGSMGRRELLLSAAVALDRRELAAVAVSGLDGSLGTGRGAADVTTAWGEAYRDPGLFFGLSGLGYGLLRAACPERLPCVLRWD